MVSADNKRRNLRRRSYCRDCTRNKSPRGTTAEGNTASSVGRLTQVDLEALILDEIPAIIWNHIRGTELLNTVH